MQANRKTTQHLMHDAGQTLANEEGRATGLDEPGDVVPLAMPGNIETGQPGETASGAGSYPENWPEIAKRIKDAAGWRCERCKEPHRVEGAFVLTVHHLDGNKANCADWNLAALCQRWHLKIQGRVRMDQMFFVEILDVSEWFKPHLEGYLRSRLPNDQGEARRCK